MAASHPLLYLGLLVATGVLVKWWLDDYRLFRRGEKSPTAKPLPGATPASLPACALAAGGALVLLAVETGGEYALGLTAQQSRMTVLFGLYTLGAALMEEVIFRGYLVVENRGRGGLIAGIIGASLGFAALHPFLWEWSDAGLVLRLRETKAWFSTGMIFLGSLWFYAVRFMPLNPQRSLLPCFAAHLAKNAGVFVIKYAQGFVSGWW